MTLDQVYVGMQVMAGVFGALFGSFLNVCIVRMPEDRSVAWPGSACPHCGKPVRPYDNVPIFAWFWLGGRCRDCRTPFSGLYPTIEALFCLLIVLLFRRVVPDIADVDPGHLVAFVWYGWLLFALVGLTFIDLRHKIIPDAFSVYSIPVAVAGAALLERLGYTHAVTWQQSVVGAAVGGFGLAGLMALYKLIRRREGMGLGDAKLLGLLGAYFGAAPALPFIVVGASLFGSVIGVLIMLARRKSLQLALPFGPFLAAAAVVYLFFGGRVVVQWTSLATGWLL